ncbi:MAG: HEAT repeat domain-containing protein [Ignavibacteria bacterium]|nr:HEAT repeat domain-containing protein [Ignavibacteria bacterium]
MKKLIFILSLVLSCSNAFSQQHDINTLLDQTLRNRGLTREDITIPIEFFSTAEKNPTNDVKLTLPLVKDMMTNPLRSETWLDSVSMLCNDSLRVIFTKCFDLLSLEKSQNESQYSIYVLDPIKNINELKDFLKSNSQIGKREIYNCFTPYEIKYLQQNYLAIFEEEAEDNYAKDIFRYNILRDSSIEKSRKVIETLSKLISEPTATSNFRFFHYQYLDLVLYIYKLLNSYKLGNLQFEEKENEFVKGEFLDYIDEDGIRIAIGGPGKNIYNGKFDFIIDLGADDIYNIEHPPLTKGGQRGVLDGGGFSCIIDLAGNDYYTTSSDFALAGGLFSSSFIFDKEGDDFYESKGSGNLGAAIGGLGLLYDEKGNDTYKGISFSIGAGCFGVGLLVDREGNDFYIANSYSQGFGMTEGVGAIIDNKGNDSYLVDSRSLDIGRYNDHYVSMCQGYGLGLRPFYAGGIGLIIEGEGNDIYNTDIFGQGGAYWYSLGAIVDKGGHDKYNGYQYSQGAGIHLAVGLLKDYDGWDFYQSNGVSQGCGHDFGFGMLWDVKGNDNYSAYSLSQGAGNADGIGILIDESGTDGYLNKYPANTRGYGNPRREYGSIGVFLDASGSDYYSQPGYDSTFINSSNWGVFTDFDYTDLPEQVSGDNFKVQLDTNRKADTSGIKGHDPLPGTYTTEEYFMMAKTIEPRFSLWQEYGFKKLVEDSTNTANYIVTKFNTTDHRDVQVFRVLSQKIQWSLAQVLLDKFRLYTTGAGVFTQAELSMMCYIFGETKDSLAKDYLLQLTYDENYRLRSSAINALGKIKYDTSDVEFINKVTTRLSELARERSEKKLYNKDIAFALGNYITPSGVKTLLDMLGNPFYGARFVAADNLRKFPVLLNTVITSDFIPEYFMDELSMVAFINSLYGLNSNDLKIMLIYMSASPVYSSEAVTYNLIELFKYKIENSGDKGIDVWYQNQLNELQSQVPLKVK